jgi:hypothetical protein
MKLKHLFIILTMFFLLVSALTGNFITEASPDFVKTPITLEAKDVLPAKLLSGDKYVGKTVLKTTASSIPIS